MYISKLLALFLYPYVQANDKIHYEVEIIFKSSKTSLDPVKVDRILYVACM